MNQPLSNKPLVKTFFAASEISQLTRRLMESLTDKETETTESISEADLLVCDEDGINWLGKCKETGKTVIFMHYSDAGQLQRKYSITSNVILHYSIGNETVTDCLKKAAQSVRESAEHSDDGVAEDVAVPAKVLKILVVDDDSNNIRSAKKLLAGHNLTTTSTHDSASSEIKNNDFEVLLCDLRLPKNLEDSRLAGFGIALMLQAAKKGVPRIAIYTRQDHHADPVASAIFRHFSEGELVPVGKGIVKILPSRIHEGAKDWAHALEEVMK